MRDSKDYSHPNPAFEARHVGNGDQSSMNKTLAGTASVPGKAGAELLVSQIELSFWGGVDPWTGKVIDQHHDLMGQDLEGKILAIPSGRGSCASSGVIMELLMSGRCPRGILLQKPDEILTFGVIVAEEVLGRSLPVVVLGDEGYAALGSATYAVIDNDRVVLGEQVLVTSPAETAQTELPGPDFSGIALSEWDRGCLEGRQGKAAQAAMTIILRMARLQGADTLFNVSRAHIDGCVYTGPASLKFTEQFLEWGGQVAVPTTLNSISVDKRLWREQGIHPVFGEPAERLGDIYVEMGAKPTFTCAPYLLDDAPLEGEQIAWAESNAVVYANSVLGARTLKYPDYLDACIALTGRAPFAGCHTDAGRKPALHIKLPAFGAIDDDFFPLLGYHVGKTAANRIPVISGIADLDPTRDNLKAFSAAFAVTSSAPMFHMLDVTPEARSSIMTGDVLDELDCHMVEPCFLSSAWRELNQADGESVGLVSFGNPHFSLSEFKMLAEACKGRRRHHDVNLMITSGRDVFNKALEIGAIETLRDFGATFSTDTCWCQIGEPVILPRTRVIMTNSAKYAHYGPGLTGRQFRFGSLAACVDAACSGLAPIGIPKWLSPA